MSAHPAVISTLPFRAISRSSCPIGATPLASYRRERDGTDKAALIAGYAETFLSALTVGAWE